MKSSPDYCVDKAPAITMDEDCDEKDDTKRRTRNLSEKKRRDQFNVLVTELGNLITNSSKKMDKSSVLKSTITFLKNHNEVTVRSRAHDVQEDWKPAFLSNEEFTYLVLEALEAFVMVFSPSGRIHYASESISSLLGHNAGDLVNKNIFDLTLEEDRVTLYNLLQKNTSAVEQLQNTSKESEIIRFQIHMRRGTIGSLEDFSYDLIQFYGHFRSQRAQTEEERDMRDIYRQVIEPGVLFVCIGRLHSPLLMRDVSLVDPNRNEFTSRHSLEWKFLFLDHRAPPIIGYLPFEVLGTSGYDYYHFDDLEKVVSCHEALIEKGELTSCHYRFLTKGQQWIWLQTRFYITYHQWNSKPEFVVCTHRVVSYDDVIKTKEESVELERNSVLEPIEAHIMNDPTSESLMLPSSPTYLPKAEVYESTYDASQKASEWESRLTISPLNVEPLSMSPTHAAKQISPSPSCMSVANVSPLGMSPAMSTGHVSPLPVISSPEPESEPDIEQPISPSFTSVTVSDEFGNTFQLVSQKTLMMSPDRFTFPEPSPFQASIRRSSSLNNLTEQSTVNELYTFDSPPSQKRLIESPTYWAKPSMPSPKMLETTCARYFTVSQDSVHDMCMKSASASSTTGTINTAASTSALWPRSHSHYLSGGCSSDTASLSGESHTSRRNSERESHNSTETSVALQRGLGAQYLDQSVYGVGVLVSQDLMPISTVPVLVKQDQTQNQDQLQKKHEELQQMIMRQQEELQQVKEQLLLARLGILHPIVPNAYATPEQNQQRISAQLGYTHAPQVIAGYAHHVALPLPQYSVHIPHPPLTTHLSQNPHSSHAPHPPLTATTHLSQNPPHIPLPPHTPIPPHTPHPMHPQHSTLPPQTHHPQDAIHPPHTPDPSHPPHSQLPQHPPNPTDPHQHMPE